MTLTEAQILICDYCQKQIIGREYHQIMVAEKHFCNRVCKNAYRYPKGSRSFVSGNDENEKLLKEIEVLCQGQWLSTSEIRKLLKVSYEKVSKALILGYQRGLLTKSKTPQGQNKYYTEKKSQ